MNDTERGEQIPPRGEDERDTSGSPLMAAPRWYVAQTHVHGEAKAASHLLRQGYQVYFPRYLKRRSHARRVETAAAPLFPRYLFVAIDLAAQRWHPIQSTIGVSRLVTNGDLPAPVPLGVIEALRRREDSNGLIQLQPRPRFARGDKIRVIEGAFCDSLGLFEGVTSGERVAILLDLLGRKVRIVLDTQFIDAA